MNTTADPRSRSASGPERAASTSAAATPAGSAAPSAWGRSARLGGGTGRLVVVSLVLGVLLAALLGVIAYGLAGTADPADPRRPWVLGLVVASGALPVLAGTVWMLLVDRATIKGPSATRRSRSSPAGTTPRPAGPSTTCSWCSAWAHSWSR